VEHDCGVGVGVGAGSDGCARTDGLQRRVLGARAKEPTDSNDLVARSSLKTAVKVDSISSRLLLSVGMIERLCQYRCCV
jgi:hypothetical protein